MSLDEDTADYAGCRNSAESRTGVAVALDPKVTADRNGAARQANRVDVEFELCRLAKGAENGTPVAESTS